MQKTDIVSVFIAGIDILPEAISAGSKQTRIHQQRKGQKGSTKKLPVLPLVNRDGGTGTARAGHQRSWCIGEENQQEEAESLGAAYLEAKEAGETLGQLVDEPSLPFRDVPGRSALISPWVWLSREPDGPQDGRGTPDEPQERRACGA